MAVSLGFSRVPALATDTPQLRLGPVPCLGAPQPDAVSIELPTRRPCFSLRAWPTRGRLGIVYCALSTCTCGCEVVRNGSATCPRADEETCLVDAGAGGARPRPAQQPALELESGEQVRVSAFSLLMDGRPRWSVDTFCLSDWPNHHAAFSSTSFSGAPTSRVAGKTSRSRSSRRLGEVARGLDSDQQVDAHGAGLGDDGRQLGPGHRVAQLVDNQQPGQLDRLGLVGAPPLGDEVDGRDGGTGGDAGRGGDHEQGGSRVVEEVGVNASAARAIGVASCGLHSPLTGRFSWSNTHRSSWAPARVWMSGSSPGRPRRRSWHRTSRPPGGRRRSTRDSQPRRMSKCPTHDEGAPA